jgi:hypothetical protein
MFKAISNWFSPKNPPVSTQKTWRTGMWVVYQDRVGVLFALGDPCEVHYTNPTTGENTDVGRVPMSGLRQARYPEIPSVRRLISAEKALELGYGP